MNFRRILTTTAIATCSSLAIAQTATISLSSPQAGQTVQAGATVEWEIYASVSMDDNQGLALVLTDLVQDLANPATLDLQPADGVPIEMESFSRPAGFSNPGDDGGVTGYVGLLRPDAFGDNLLEIGGGQNTFGQVPASGGIGETTTVVTGLGQAGAVLVASGSLVVGDTAGSYTLRLERARANVITATNATGTSFTQPAVVGGDEAITFAVGTACPADLDGNGAVDISDLAIVLANFGASSATGDADSDGDVDLSDLATVLASFGETC